jgi:tellurite resistance protein TerC
MDVSLYVWVCLIAGLASLLALDFIFGSRKPHDVKFKEAAIWSVFYIGVAIGFGAWVWSAYGSSFGTEYFAAYLVEKSLSVDNLFVFAIILTQFAVPSVLHQRVLLLGVIFALIFRAVFIALGAAALHAFAFTFVIFGAILIWTGYSLFKHWDEDPEPTEGRLVQVIRKFVPISDSFEGEKLVTKIDGKRYGTPLLLALFAIASTDLLFALDSIPATYGVTSEPFLVFAANAFALLGLRALFFLLKGLLDKLVYLSLGLSAILIFIGVKLMLIYLHEILPWVPKISTSVSLLVIAAILIAATVASLRKVRLDPEARAHPGRLTDADI